MIISILQSICVLVCLSATGPIVAAEINIRDFGATPNDATDDTKAIAAAMTACEKAGGGVVFVPAGTYLVSRQASESPILELPSNAIVRGEGAVSVIKFNPRVNQTNFWRMMGAGAKGCHNATVCQLRLDGSNTYLKYEQGKTPEQNHGIFLYREKGTGIVENVTLRDLLVENFSGDCVCLGIGCRNITISQVTVRNFVRQGIQLGGGDGARDYLITGCQDLEGTVDSGGSTIHVEHANGLSNVIISDNRCRRSILATGVDGLILRGNTVTGRILADYNRNTIVQGNIVRGGAGKQSVMQFGFADGLLIKDNVVLGDNPQAPGIYVWGSTRYDPKPSKQVSIIGNLIRVRGGGISLNAVEGGLVRDNLVELTEGQKELVMSRSKNIDASRGKNEDRRK